MTLTATSYDLLVCQICKSRRRPFPHHDCTAWDGRRPKPFGLLVSECNSDCSEIATQGNREGFLSLKLKDIIWYLRFKWVASEHDDEESKWMLQNTWGEESKCSTDSLPTQKSGVSPWPNTYPENNGVHKHALTRTFLVSHLNILSRLRSYWAQQVLHGVSKEAWPRMFSRLYGTVLPVNPRASCLSQPLWKLISSKSPSCHIPGSGQSSICSRHSMSLLALRWLCLSMLSRLHAIFLNMESLFLPSFFKLPRVGTLSF